ncbi:hypothetical protein DL96DRAFT_1490822 [Flagelloscypha sp. PMI_526]|nr:hypothetical protein DL96DRAFT_1490822 [Flagelloscypha sp. PMI_526]
MTTAIPSNDPSTYRDLLLFEERLKTNAASLQKRKNKYQFFLLQLLLVITLLLAEVLFIQPAGSSVIALPYAFVASRCFPDGYDSEHPAVLDPYVSSGLLFVSATTLVLFFASGMYRDKIAYANRYVPQANRALRSFNMYLNVRKPPLRSRFMIPYIPWLLRSSQVPVSPTSRRSSPDPVHTRSRSPSVAASQILNPIPPAVNPRGELIFSSRIDKSFRDGYEKHRAAFERRRQEKERREHLANSLLYKIMFWRSEPIPRAGSPGAAIPRHGSSPSASGSVRGRSGLSRSTTPEHTYTPRSRSPPTPNKDGSLRRRKLESTIQRSSFITSSQP